MCQSKVGSLIFVSNRHYRIYPGHAKLWWKFAYTANLETGLRRRKREFYWPNIKEYCNLRRQYFDNYKKKLLDQAHEDLSVFEKKLNIITIVIVRARAEIDCKKILDKSKKEQDARGWFGGWFSKTPEEDTSVISNLKNEFTPEEKQKLFFAVGYEENALSVLYPADYIAHRVNFNIKEFKILIFNEFSDTIKLELNLFNFNLTHRPSSSNLILTSHLDSLAIIGKHDSILRAKEAKEFMFIQFEMNPLNKSFDFGLDLKMKSTYLLYDIDLVNQLYNMFKPQESISLDELNNYAQYKIDDLKQQTSLNFSYAIDKKKQFKIQISIDPSYVIVPKLANISDAKSIVLVSLGTYTVFLSCDVPSCSFVFR